MTRSIRGLFRSSRGAVAPTVALSLFGLIAAGGIAFDYARLATLDTELQSAADQAALAAAGQLDGQDGACARAAAAASALLVNNSYLANEPTATSQQVTVSSVGVADCSGNANIQFYTGYDDATETFVGAPLEAGDDALAKVVWLRVDPRQVYYALTPIVAALQSGEIRAEAVAGLSSSICKVPPVMICNPLETSGDPNFTVANYIGDGIRLTTVGQGGSWAPGNFGYLDSTPGDEDDGADALKKAIGWDSPPGECSATTGVTTKPGANTTVTDALNTRFDLYNANSCLAGGSCPASINSVKDVRRAANANGNNACRVNQNHGWWLDTGYYGDSLPTTAAALTDAEAEALSAIGHPRDMCHAVSQDGTCTGGRIGDGSWDANAYFRRNYIRTFDGTRGAAGTRWDSDDWQANTGLSPTVSKTIPGPNPGDSPQLNPAYASRYNVYLWEIANRDMPVDGLYVLASNPAGVTGNERVSHGKPVCSAGEGYGAGQVPDESTTDRRRISAAVINCTASGVSGSSSDVPVIKWISLFLVEPSLNRSRTHSGDIYVELIGETIAGGDDVIRRDVPYLIR